MVSIIGTAIEAHCALSPGLLESAYDACRIFWLQDQVTDQLQCQVPEWRHSPRDK